jgi:hypothetical protein
MGIQLYHLLDYNTWKKTNSDLNDVLEGLSIHALER